MSDFRGPTLSELQGSWQIVRYGENGKKGSFFQAWFSKRWFRIEGTHYEKFDGLQTVEKGLLDVTTGDECSFYDELIQFGPHHGRHHRGIVRFVGTKIEHLQAPIHHPRPDQFVYKKGCHWAYSLWRRA